MWDSEHRAGSDVAAAHGPAAAALLARLRDAVALVEVPAGGGQPRVAYVNAAFCELTGYCADTVVGTSPRRFEAPGTDAGEIARLWRAVEHGATAQTVVLIATADGSRRWVDAEVVPVSDPTPDQRGRPGAVAAVLRDVTAQVRRDALVAAAGDQPCDLLAVVDADGGIVELEPPQRPVLGHAPATLAQRGLLGLAHRGDADQLRTALARPADAGRLVVRLRHADGSWRWLETAVSDHHRDPRLAGIVVAARDASSREHARAELARTTEQLHMAVGIAGLRTWQLDLTEATVTEDALTGEGVQLDPDAPPMTLEQGLAYIHDDDREGFRAAIVDAVARGGGFDHTFRVADADGVWHRLLARGQVIHDADGTPVQVNGVTFEVTERQPDGRDERHPEGRDERHPEGRDLARPVEDAIDACYVLDDQWRVRYANVRGAQVLDRGRDELIDRPLWEALPDASAGIVQRSCHEAATSGRNVEFPMLLSPSDCWYQVRVSPGDDELVVWLHDITEQMHGEAQQRRLVASERSARRAAATAEAQLATASAHDELTGLLNRTELERRLRRMLADHAALVAVLFIDLDSFRVLNNSLGHALSDTVLRNVAARIAQRCRAIDLTARFAGDKFVVALDGTNLDEALAIADRLRAALHEPYELEGRRVVITASVGVATATTADTAEVVLRNADTAVASSKRTGRGHITVYDDSLHHAAVQHLDTESDLVATRHGEQLVVHYQPVFDLRDGRRASAEALLRWHHPTRGLLHPGSFIDVAETSELIVPMGTWVIEQACRAVAQRRADGPGPTVWVNVAAPQLLSPDFATRVADIQQRHGLADGELGVELTERTMLINHDTIAAQLQQLRGQGVRIAIDDFGTGYSSMSLLQQCPIDVLKIDHTFTANHDTVDGDAIIRAIVQLAGALNATACAEGIETRAQLEAIRATGCELAMGYLLGRPGPEPLPTHVEL